MRDMCSTMPRLWAAAGATFTRQHLWASEEKRPRLGAMTDVLPSRRNVLAGKHRLTLPKLLIGQILIAFAIVGLGLWAATQTRA
jgi:hypothetical protein